MPQLCRVAKGLDCLSHLNNTVRPCSIHTQMPCYDHAALQATSQGHGTARQGHGMMCGRSVQARLLPTTTRSFTTGSSNFSGYTRTFTKDTALSGDERSTAQRGRCELARYGTPGARHGVCKLALKSIGHVGDRFLFLDSPSHKTKQFN